MIRDRKLKYFLEQCKYYAKKYELEEEDLQAEAWLRIKENERKINKKYIQLRIEAVACDLRKAELRHKCLLERVQLVEYMGKETEWAEHTEKEPHQE
ncbi:MAG: hypothetical protein GYA51_03365 [Candidatus Methanofastidiosa archaeon]|nr:hypothetical protein [Candidatus Methanofastidiosa archaeon]